MHTPPQAESAPDTHAAPQANAAAAVPAPVSFSQAWRFWLKLGFISFGGPAGQIALMHTELVERRRWISEGRFLHALNYCMLLPGPEAQQLATYLGWLMHRTWGGVVAGTLFVLPSLCLLIALSWVYLRWGHVPWVVGVFWGLKAAVTALVLHAAQRLGSRTLKTPLMWAVAGLAFVAVAGFSVSFVWVVLGAAALGGGVWRYFPQALGSPQAHSSAAQSGPAAWIDEHTPTPAHARFSRKAMVRVLALGVGLWLLVMLVLCLAGGVEGTLAQMAWFFSKAALLTFGGAYAVLPYVVDGAVGQFGWLSTAQMMDGLALGESTPGPLIMVVAFVGFVGGWAHAVLGPESLFFGGVLAACVVTFFTFLPSFIFILAGGPLVEATHGKLGFTAPLQAITAAVVGVILHLALVFAHHLFWPQGFSASLDAAAVVLALGAWVALWRYHVNVVHVLGACAALGLCIRTFV